MAWAGSTTGNSTNISNTTFTDLPSDGATVLVSLNPREIAHVMVEVNFAATPTDDADVRVLSSVDNGTEFDTSPIIGPIRIDNGTDPARISFMVMGVRSFKVQGANTGSTDTHAYVVEVNKDGVSAT